jgi:hypothetical protein
VLSHTPSPVQTVVSGIILLFATEISGETRETSPPFGIDRDPCIDCIAHSRKYSIPSGIDYKKEMFFDTKGKRHYAKK